MIELKLNDTNYQIKTRWEDVTWAQYCKLLTAKELNTRLSITTGMDAEIINILPFETLSNLLSLSSFVDEHEQLPLLSKPYESQLNIGAETYGKLERAKLAIKKHENSIESGARIVELYTGEKISDKPVTEVFNIVSFFLSKYQTFLNATSV